jgi:hypothetical protein
MMDDNPPPLPAAATSLDPDNNNTAPPPGTSDADADADVDADAAAVARISAAAAAAAGRDGGNAGGGAQEITREVLQQRVRGPLKAPCAPWVPYVQTHTTDTRTHEPYAACTPAYETRAAWRRRCAARGAPVTRRAGRL